MLDTEKYGLVLEGGGMRGVFTCGVLDCFMDNKLKFPYVVGVSAGACNGLSYMSNQRGRAKYSNIDLLEKYRYIGFKQLIMKGNIMDYDLLFHTFPEKILPYDYDAYARSEGRFEMVTTNCLTGEANYFEEKNNQKRIIDIVKASSSLPIVCPIVNVDNIPMLDGGLVDSIPLERSISQGWDKNVVVLTRNKGYRKEMKKAKLPPFMYRKYPEIRRVYGERNKIYNTQLDFVEKMEDEGRVLVIRPERPVEVDRIEKNTAKLLKLYNQGYEMGEKFMSKYKR